jgi:hypothetical protein
MFYEAKKGDQGGGGAWEAKIAGKSLVPVRIANQD